MIEKLDIPLNLDHNCMTRVMEVSDNATLFSMFMEYAPSGEMFKKKEKSKKKVITKLQFYQISRTIVKLQI